MANKEFIRIKGLNDFARFPDILSLEFDKNDSAATDISFVTNEDLTIRHIYIQQQLCFSEHKNKQESIQCKDDLSFGETYAKFEDCVEFVYDIGVITVGQTQFVDNTLSQIIKDDKKLVLVENNQQTSLSVCLSQTFNVGLIQPSYLKNNLYYYKDKFEYCQSWCQSEIIDDDNLIKFVINSDIVVNDVVYSTVSIPYYKFTIFDRFNFFVNGLSTNNCTTLKQKFYMQSNIEDEQVSKFYKIQTETEMHQKIFVNSKQYFVLSDIDGVIFNNNISLTQGTHRFKIRKLKTPKTYFFTINIVNPYLKRLDGKIYDYDLKTLDNAKVLSYYQLQEQQINITDDDVAFK